MLGSSRSKLFPSFSVGLVTCRLRFRAVLKLDDWVNFPIGRANQGLSYVFSVEQQPASHSNVVALEVVYLAGCPIWMIEFLAYTRRHLNRDRRRLGIIGTAHQDQMDVGVGNPQHSAVAGLGAFFLRAL